MKKKKVQLIVENKLEKMTRKIDSVEEAVSNIEDYAMEIMKFDDEKKRKYGREMVKAVNKVHANDMDPEAVKKLARVTGKAIQDTKEFALYPSFGYLKHVLQGGW